MSTLEEREQLIQQRQAEKYINVIRLVLLGFLTLVVFARSLTPWAPLLVGAWVYAIAVHAALSRGFFPRYLPWVTTVVDLAAVALGLGIEVLRVGFGVLAPGLTWVYALLFLLVLFSTLRERPGLTIANGVAGSVLYLGFLVGAPTTDPGFWWEQVFRVLLLLLACFFSSFHARSVRKAFQRAATSDRLRRETDARLKVLALHFPGVLFQAEVGETFHLRYVSEGSRDLLGLDSRDLLADPNQFFSRAQPDLLTHLESQLALGADGYRTWEQEFSYTVGERTLWLKLSVTTHRNPAGVLVLNGLVSDVSEQRRVAKALEEANQAKTDFLATMSHELRTPLNAILGNAEDLSRLAANDDDRRAFRDLQLSGETLLGLIEDILVFSRLEAGRLSAELRPLAWKLAFEGLLDSFRGAASAKGLTLGLRIPPGVPTLVWTDALRLRQILSNLVSNAIKFTPSGSITVEASFEPGDQSPWLVVQVIDTGIGISPQQQARIFEKFTQGEHGKSRTYGGLGLGLSISLSLAQLLGGTLTVVSAVGQGSRFTLRLPVRTGESPEPSNPAAGAGPPVPVRAPRVLVVEDNPSNQDVALRMLKKLGAQVDLASGGHEALSRVATTFYDLILMDWQMPVMDGREATARIRALPGGQDLVIVALSGHALPGDRELLLASGFDDYLSKPVRMDDFRATLAKWVNSPRGPG